jgi:murein DD-endopeptidase MepM/ murein hydrolase activator NlpD
MKRTKLYRFSLESLSFQETHWTKFRLMLVGSIIGGILLIIMVAVNQHYGDFFGLRFLQQDALVNENRVLQNQLKVLNNRLDNIQNQLSMLGEKGNELRLMADLPKFDDDLQKLGTGGTEDRIDFTSSASVNAILNNLRTAANQVEKELTFQSASYQEIEKTSEQNKVRFAHLPAVKPMEGFYNKSDFGMRMHPILNIYRKHEGIDIINDSNTPVYASADGVVEYAARRGGYGMAVEINHGFSLKSLYGHLSKILVKEGQHVKRGDLIARSGNTGLSNGPHLHYEVRVNGVAQNPTDYFFDDVKVTDLQKAQQ